VVRLVGVDLPNQKKIEYGLRVIHGIGATTALKIIEKLEINKDTRVRDLTNEQIILLRETLENPNLLLEGDLRRYNGLNIKRLNDINCHRGKRHRTSLPVRGQRTRTNARARRGSKKTVSGKKN
jgi:small subunit ribosomal protein S13